MHPTYLIQLVEEHAVTLRSNAAEHRLIDQLRDGRSRSMTLRHWLRSARDRTWQRPLPLLPVATAPNAAE